MELWEEEKEVTPGPGGFKIAVLGLPSGKKSPAVLLCHIEGQRYTRMATKNFVEVEQRAAWNKREEIFIE